MLLERRIEYGDLTKRREGELSYVELTRERVAATALTGDLEARRTGGLESRAAGARV